MNRLNYQKFQPDGWYHADAEKKKKKRAEGFALARFARQLSEKSTPPFREEKKRFAI